MDLKPIAILVSIILRKFLPENGVKRCKDACNNKGANCKTRRSPEHFGSRHAILKIIALIKTYFY